MDEIMSRQLTRKQTQVLEAMVAGPTPSAKKGRFSYKIVSGDNRAENVVSVLKGQRQRRTCQQCKPGCCDLTIFF